MDVSEGVMKQNKIQALVSTPSEPSAYHVLFLLSPTSPRWYRPLHARIRHPFDVHILSDLAMLDQHRETHPPDVIVGSPDEETLRLFTALEPMDSLLRPLRVLVTTAAWDETTSDAVDVIVPSSLQGFHCQLRTTLRMRAQAFAARQRSAALELELEQQRRTTNDVNLLKNTIVRNVSHELRTPILHLKAAVAMLAEDNDNNKLAQYATEATARVEAVVKNIAQLAASLDIQIAPVLVREVVDQAVRYLQRSWQHKDAVTRVVEQLDDPLPPVLGDKQGLVTVLQLLIDNALKFSEGTVDVTARLVGAHVVIAVRDNGIGIAAEEVDKIFDSFYQVDSSSTRRYGGTGVGLAIVKLILDRHDVQITVQSEPGKGSTFAFHLPLADIHAESSY